MEELAAGIRRWTAPHPEWRPTVERVPGYALSIDDALVLVDPLLPPAAEAAVRAALLGELDELAQTAARVEIMITIPYHTRSSEELHKRWRETRPVRLWGHAAVASRLRDAGILTVIEPPEAGDHRSLADGLARAFAIGRPRRYEMPLSFPALATVVFGDAIVGTGGRLAVWEQSKTRPGWQQTVFAPTFASLLEEPLERVLVTHGDAVLHAGATALRAALAAPPVAMY